MAQKIQLISWSYLDSANEQGQGSFYPGDPSLWQVIEASVGSLQLKHSSAIIVEWTDTTKPLSKEEWKSLLGFSGIIDVEIHDSAQPGIQVRERARQSTSIETLFLEYLSTMGRGEALSVCEVDYFMLHSLSKDKDEKLIIESLEKLLQFGERSAIFDARVQEARVCSIGSDLHWPRVKANEDFNFIDQVTKTKPNPLTAKYVVKESGANFKDGDVVSTYCPHELLSYVDEGQLNESTYDPISLFLGLQARSSAHFSRLLHKKVETYTAFLNRGVSMAFTTEKYPLVSYLDFSMGLRPNFPGSFSSKSEKGFLYLIEPVGIKNSYLKRKLDVFQKRLSFIDGTSSILTSVYFGISSAIARVAAAEQGMLMFEVALKSVSVWEQNTSVDSQCLFFWVPPEEKKSVESMARDLGLNSVVVGQKQDKSSVTIVGDSDDIQEISLAEIVDSLQTAFDKTFSASWSYDDDKKPSYGFERANIYPDRFLMRSTQKNKVEMEVGNLMSAYFSGDLSRMSVQRGSFSYPLRVLRWSDGQKTVVEAGAQIKGIGKLNPRIMGEHMVDEGVRWLLTQGAVAEGAIASVHVSLPHLDPAKLKPNQRAYLALAFDGIQNASQEFGIQVSSINSSTHAGPDEQIEFVLRLTKVIAPNTSLSISGFRMDDELLYAVGPRPPFVEAASKILPYVRVVSNHVTELSFSQQKDLYAKVEECIRDSIISSMRPVMSGGIAEALGEMALWSGLGAKVKPTIPTIELFSGSPGRFVVGVLPQFVKDFEETIPREFFTQLGATGGKKVLSLPLEELYESREKLANPKEEVAE